MTYEQALMEFNKLPHVNNDQLDGTISHLVFRAQHELDLLHEGEWNDDLSFTQKQQGQIRGFIMKHGTKEERQRMLKDTPGIVKHRRTK